MTDTAKSAGDRLAPHTFFCLDGHTAGNPVRLVAGGGPRLQGDSMSARRQEFMRRFDWIRTGLMFEPRGHDLMSGTILYPPTTEDGDVGVLFIETTGCLPMCGHGAIGTVTFALERGLVQPAVPGKVALDTPAGRVSASYAGDQRKIEAVRIENVASFLTVRDLEIEVPGFRRLRVDIAYGGNFYAIVDPQEGFEDMATLGAERILRHSPEVREAVNRAIDLVHPDDPTIRGCSHVMWTGRPTRAGAAARNAVFYGARAIDRSPCGTGTSARMAQLAARGELTEDSEFVHESIIGSLFKGRIERRSRVGEHDAIIPSIEGSAHLTALNTIFLDPSDPYVTGFQVG